MVSGKNNPYIEGKYHSDQTSQDKDLNALIEHEAIFLFDGKDLVHQYSLKDTTISSRLGNIPRRFHFPDGSLFETPSNDLVDQVLASTKYRQRSWAFLMESRWKIVCISLITLLFTVYFFISHINPWMAKKLAPIIPHSWSIKISDTVIKQLEKAKIFRPQKENQNLKKRIQKWFENFKKDFPDLKMDLRFVSSPVIQANAMAFPGGRIIITDELLETFSENENQVLSVLLHEIGHVYHHHPIELMIKDSTLSLAAFFILGDGGLIGFSLLLLRSHYSRQVEQQADEFTLNQMLRKGIPTEAFAEALTHLKNQDNRGTQKLDKNEDNKNEGKDKDKKNKKEWSIPPYLSTHPDIDTRIERARQKTKEKDKL